VAKAVKAVKAAKAVKAVKAAKVVKAATLQMTTHPVYQVTLAHSTGRIAPNRFAPRSRPEATNPMISAVSKTPMP